MKLKLLDLFERAASSAAQQFFIACVAVGVTRLSGLPWVFALSTAGGVFVVSIVTTLISDLVGLNNLSFKFEVARRVVVTFLQSLLANLGAGVVDIIHVHWVTALNIAALAAFASLAKCVLAPHAPYTPSLLPLHDVPPQEGDHR